MSCKGRGKPVRVLAAALAVLAGLSGCAGMLERDYVTAEAHVENPAPQGDAAYRVESYPALCAALLSYVEEGMERGLLRFPTTYGGNLTVDLEKAKERLLREEPLGAYAVEDVDFRVSRIISYYEVELSVTYRLSRDEIKSLIEVDNPSELRELLEKTLEERTERVTALVSGCPLDEEGYLEDAVGQAYVERPALALGRPEVTARTWPEQGTRRVVELTLSYPEKTSGLGWTREPLLRRAKALAAESEPTHEGVFDALQGWCTYDPEGGNTVADCLLVGRAGSEGMALGYKLLCDEKGLSCQVEHSEGLWYVSWRSEGETVYLDVTGQAYEPGAEPPQLVTVQEGETP